MMRFTPDSTHSPDQKLASTTQKEGKVLLPIIVHNGVEPVSNGKNCAVSELPPNRLLNEFISFQVHRGRGFIKNKDFAFAEQRTR